jgi:hypothetical protein
MYWMIEVFRAWSKMKKNASLMNHLNHSVWNIEAHFKLLLQTAQKQHHECAVANSELVQQKCCTQD